MKLLSIVAALSLSFLSMTEGANLRSVHIHNHKQAPVSKGKESPIEGSLRQQILDDNSDAAWERDLKKKSVKAKKKKGGKDKKKKGKKKMKKKKQKKSKKKSNKGLSKKQKRNCERNPTNYSYCPVLVTATAAIYVVPDTPTGRKLQTNESNLSVAAMGALEVTIRNLLEDEGFDVDSVTIISITANYLVTYDAVLNLPQGTSEAQAQSIVDGALNDITQEEFQDELQDNLSGLDEDDCGDGIQCSDLGNATKTVSTLSPTGSPSSSPSKAPTGAPSKAPTSSPSSSPTTSAPTPEVSEDDLTPSPSPSPESTPSPSPSVDPLTPSPSPSPESTPSPSPSVDPLTPSPSPSIDNLIESTADGEVIPWEQDRYLV